MKMKDQIGRQLNIDTIPKRIISLVPSQTELLYDLGLEHSIVGITKFCVHPFHFKSIKQIVGGTKQISIEKIKALKPDIILCNKEENTKDIVEACEAICTTHVSDIVTIENCIEVINQYGEIFNKQINAQKISDKINVNLKDFKTFIKSKPTLKAAYFIWRNPWMAAGSGTFINHLLELNKFENIYKNLERYPEIELKNLRLEGDPEIVLLSSEPYPFKNEHALEVGSASQHAKIIFVDGEMFSWYGSRLIKAFNYFKTLRENF
ncbi:ABC transporter substrate-binding protein [Lacinutrix sp. Bg11-31]|uniref:ABC transporter substrate-binding protein n=1 Tax=Lacinutrix sp. Bg11-31 TaxID=2057808 RepID=UPI000C3152DA|nr:helical backbone metal receptor [Lacinutrix sp. Bg11-31]AUC82216.1 cobalamin-binding protein [Lacinutrix sp. Bg11-31]